VKINGTATINASPDRVWAALNDPAVLVRTIPGVERLEAVGDDRYRMTVTAGVASIKGTYLGDVALTDPVPPSAFTLKASGAGAPGTVSADVRVTLDDAGDGRTRLRYDADAVVGGAVGGVGQRVLAGVAKRTAGEFFTAVEAVLTESTGPAPTGHAGAGVGAPAVAAVSAPVGTPVGGSIGPSEPPVAVPAVFTRPPSAGAGDGRLDVLATQLAGVVIGAAIALVAVWVGARLGGRRG